MAFPLVSNVPFISRDQMIEVDRLMIDVYAITLLQMMENAGRSLAIIARERFLSENCAAKKILVMAGNGGNGGGAMVAARRLAAWGGDVSLTLSHEKKRMAPAPAQQLAILGEMKVPLVGLKEAVAGQYDLIIDGLIGYSLNGAPRGMSAELIKMANHNKAPVLALDVPSGLDASLGVAHDPAILAKATLTLALPKTGLKTPNASKWVGELYCADISVPPALYAGKSIGLKVANIFQTNDIIKIF